MTDNKEVPQNDPNARAGYTFDPYADGCQLADIHDPRIPFHNYRQIHVGEIAFFDGANARTRADLSPCPPMWMDVQHYWKTMQDIGYESTHPDEKGPIRTVLTLGTGILKNEFTVMTGSGAKADWPSIAIKVLSAIPITLIIQFVAGILGIHISI